MQNPWDTLSEKFNGYKNAAEIDPDAADNILIAWPPMIAQIEKHFKNNNDISILDYGCGTGTLCEKLWKLGYKNISGIDSSQAMVQTAQNAYGDHIKFIQYQSESKTSAASVDVIIGSMVFQFVESVEETFKSLVTILKPSGLFIFAVHNPETIKTSLQRGLKLFSGFKETESQSVGLIHLGSNGIPIFIRSAQEYDQTALKLGLSKVFEEYPPFTKEFLVHYPIDLPPDVPEYLILGYVKE